MMKTESYRHNFNATIGKRTERWNNIGHPRLGMTHSTESKIKIGIGNSGKYKGKSWDEIYGKDTADRRRLENSNSICKTNEILLNHRKSLLEEKLSLYLPMYERNIRIGKYNVDFLNRESNHIIEIYGDYWHCNPKIYNDNFIHPHHKFSSIEKHKRDSVRKQNLENLGYTFQIIWELDLDRYITETFTTA